MVQQAGWFPPYLLPEKAGAAAAQIAEMERHNRDIESQ